MKKLIFDNSDNFYKSLKEAVDSGEEVTIVTDFESYDEVPEKLKKIYNFEDHKSSQWIDPFTKHFVAESFVTGSINMNALYVMGAAVAGAGVGALAGGPIGAAAGAGIGAIVGSIAAAMSDGYDIEFVIDANGKLIIKMKKK